MKIRLLYKILCNWINLVLGFLWLHNGYYSRIILFLFIILRPKRTYSIGSHTKIMLILLDIGAEMKIILYVS